MKNPLNKRLRRELKQEFGKFAVIFLFMTATIGFISGFLVADNSIKSAYDESFTKYNIEDGNFHVEEKLDDAVKKKIEALDVNVYENFYREFDLGDNKSIRIFQERTDIDRVCLMEGAMPEKDGEIAIDRLFGSKNDFHVGDTLKMGSTDYTICGYVALSDYSAQFKNNSDMMFDANNFGVAIVTREQFAKYDESRLQFGYAWKNQKELKKSEKKDLTTDIKNVLVENRVQIDGITPAIENQAITFTGDDMGSDKAMMQVLLVVIIVILAFIFAVTSMNTIEHEASEIGTLRALGYTRRELLVHYMELPLAVTMISCILGNLLGYTCFKNVVADMYYNSYSLPTYETLWNLDAFVMTTIVPFVIMVIVNVLTLSVKLRISPLKFLHHDLSTIKTKRAVKLPNVSFLARFRMRILLQNKANYVVMFVGITFANLLVMFGLLMTPLLDHFGGLVEDHMICSDQYVLKMMVDTKETSAEKYAVTKLIMDDDSRPLTEEVMAYGVQKSSDYIKDVTLDDKGNGVYASAGILEKYGLSVGDTLRLKDEYSEEIYEFRIKGTYTYPASFVIFMSEQQFCDTFDKEEGYFNGYFSDKELTDIDEKFVASHIVFSDLMKVVRQLKDSMGAMFPLMTAFSECMALLVFYLMSKIVIEKNATAISMVKILGYNSAEIGKLYIMSTSIAAVCSIFLSILIADGILKYLYFYFMDSMSGWLSYYMAPENYVKAIVFGLLAYGFTALLQYRKISKVHMEEALKKADI